MSEMVKTTSRCGVIKARGSSPSALLCTHASTTRFLLASRAGRYRIRFILGNRAHVSQYEICKTKPISAGTEGTASLFHPMGYEEDRPLQVSRKQSQSKPIRRRLESGDRRREVHADASALVRERPATKHERREVRNKADFRVVLGLGFTRLRRWGGWMGYFGDIRVGKGVARGRGGWYSEPFYYAGRIEC
jgi:hypothetical protein